MSMTDPIADLLTRIRNGIQVRKRQVDIPASRLKSAIATTMQEEGYLAGVEVIEQDAAQPTLRVTLKYDRDGVNAITELKRTSKPGCRVYRGAKDLPVVRRGLGTVILSTPKGVMSGRKAEELGVGGEILCTLF